MSVAPMHCPECQAPLSSSKAVCTRCVARHLFDDPEAEEAPVPHGLPKENVPGYTLKRLLGEGGFGHVYLAEQQEPVRRLVALKILKPGMDSAQIIARFEAEQQALALMEHPSIARVYAAGKTEPGRPYFAMEYCDGVPITDYCRLAHLSVNERLSLFQKLCQGVHHAHAKGVLHRDLKPSNVLVVDTPEGPLPKVIDFGIAKATQQSLTDHTVFTHSQQWLGTPEYMSPEQAGGSSLDIDARTDVYSLGVILYELLTGQPPLEVERLRRAAYDEMLRLIRETEPERPSTQITTMDRDLDWITLKALGRERERRYPSAEAFAHDIARFLAGESIDARPPSMVYRLRRSTKQHRVAYVRRRGHQKSDAEDLTQGFFCQLLGRESLESIKLEEGGKLRSFLLTGIQHYITSDWRRGHAKKRGGDFALVPLEWDSAELRYAEEDDSASDSPEHAFDRLWALQTLENALARLKAEYVLAKKEALFEALQPALGLSAEAVCYDALASELNRTPGAIRTQVFRLRKQLRALLREEVLATLGSEDTNDEELRYLQELLVR